MEKPKKFEELVKILNQNVKRSEEYKKNIILINQS
jgi:hypothetical protein